MNVSTELDPDSGLVFVVEDDEIIAEHLAAQIGHFGYKVRVFHRLAGVKEAVLETPPAAMIMDLGLPDGNGADVIAEIRHTTKIALPVLFISGRDDLPSRIEAIRAGGTSFFAKPFDVNALVDRLDTLTAGRPSEPYRILVVEKDPAVAAHYGDMLKNAGMSATLLTDPMQLLPALRDFGPELILMEMNNPGCSGLELAAAIRQQESYVRIPIVFLSSEHNMDNQLSAMSLGADDFLITPITSSFLISAVATRAQRSRILHNFMVRDSLTGLLNHTRIKEQLDIEVARARRQNLQLSFVMLDIDHFKMVNDTYGHPVGDRVIKSLSRLMQQRLRKTDLIGRYGGEEFAVILTNTEQKPALKVFDAIREDFALIPQHAEGAEFTVSFSCGLASFPTFNSAATLSVAADKALYVAKRGGRNRVVLATPQ
ncbi:MAG: diguanylate cyclase [Burkholderiales bacterium]